MYVCIFVCVFIYKETAKDKSTPRFTKMTVIWHRSLWNASTKLKLIITEMNN